MIGFSLQWVKEPAGTWMPRDPNEFHNCPLYCAYWEGYAGSVHRTKDGKGWVGRARTLAPKLKRHVTVGGVFKTRREAFFNAIDRLQKAESA